MALKNYYELLEIPPSGSIDEIKRAFRQQIARYHPDKVHHLGKEFQNLAAERAAELTEAYRILSDEGRRAEYDRALAEGGGPSPTVAAAAASAPAGPSAPSAPAAEPPPFTQSPESGTPKGASFKHERASRDEFVRKATIGRS